MMTGTRRLLLVAALVLAGAAAPLAVTTESQASEIRVVVNNTPITSYDIQRRVAFLRLQQRGGNLQQVATDQMIDQTLRMQEARRLNVNVTDDQISDAYVNFARSNNLTTAQLDQILADSGVTRAHFRDFIRSQMAWAQALNARARHDQGGGMVSPQEAVRRMLEQGGEKPQSTEYMLQQVIFVVPAAERGQRLAQRRREAEALRTRFQSCETTRDFARGLIDVTVRDLGRVLAPELPPDWEQHIKAIQPGQTTQVRDTERGAEFIAVCSSRLVSDDRVAQLIFQSERSQGDAADELSERYTKELQERASITRR